MSYWRAGTCALLLTVCSLAAQGQDRVDTLSAEERAWVRAHPVLRVGFVQNQAPFEFRRRTGQWAGLTSEYLKVLKLHSGLNFDIVTLDVAGSSLSSLREKRVDLVALVRSIGVPQAEPGITYSLPYISTDAIAATRIQTSPDTDAMGLNGKTVVLSAVEAGLYGPWIRQRFDTVRIIVSTDMPKALALLSSGGADVAIASQAQLLPDLQRKYRSRLRFAELPVAMTSDVRMAMRDNDPLLASIVNKALASMSASQIRLVRQDWLGLSADELSNMQIVTEHYSEHLTLAIALLLMIAGLAYQAYHEHRRALRNERKTAMFLAVMSHEIRSPMNAVLAAVELLRFTTIDAQQRHFVDLANNGAKTLLRLLDDVLDVSKLEAGQLTLALDAVDIVGVANDVVALQQLRAKEKGIALSVTVAQAPPLLMLDEARLLQVLHNLVSNAIKFTETGGVEIQISMGAGEIESGVLELAVADTGIGITAKAQATLFRPYVQVAGTYKRSGGTGLGLVICRELIDLMHGTILLDSAPGKGTRVAISLPTAIADKHAVALKLAADAAIPAAVSKVAAPNLYILVIEDVPANQAVLQAQLASLSCKAELAQDGASALACFSQREYDLVLMDCDLPDIDGYNLAAEWRRREAEQEQARCPVIAISAATGEAHAERCFEAGMDGILSKPIRLAKLQDIIEVWCDVTLVAGVPAVDGGAVFGMPQVREAIANDIGNLLQAMAMEERDAALRAAHRLHGAALAMQWAELAQNAGALERLLRSDVALGDECFSHALQGVVQAWRASSSDCSPYL
jgi:two-component system sensor histidine kinase EvgS